MRMRFLGDSYDIVKHSLLRWLSPLGKWVTHPMFTESITPDLGRAYSNLLGTPLVSQEVLTQDTDREAYWKPISGCQEHVFLDPDTGIAMAPVRGKKGVSYVFAVELFELAHARPDKLTLVFDQALARGREREQLQAKLAAFSARGLHGVAYSSHACFVLVGKDGTLVEQARKLLLEHLPASRVIATRE